jgi:CHAP domain-containing protein
MRKKTWIASFALFVTIATGCSAPREEEARASSTSSIVCGASIGAGQCLVSVQRFYEAFGVTVGVAPGEGATDAEGRWCAAEGACLLWVLDIPSRYGWERTWNPQPFDIAVYPPNSGNAWGHVTIVHHVDDGGVWMIDSNDDYMESANNEPHLHAAAPYGFYHYSGAEALGCGAP